MNTHVVIARCYENLKWVNKLQYPYTIYNKGDDDLELPNIQLPNEGRESGTYLYHIVNNYYTLSDVLILVQGNPFDQCPDLFQMIDTFDTESITLLANALIPNDLNLVPQDTHGECVTQIVNEMGLQDYLKNYERPQYDYPFGSQWIVPKKFILNKSFNFWNKLYTIHQKLYFSAWVMERMLLHIFNHTDNNL